MKKIIFLFLITAVISCDNNSELKEMNFLFYPSFSNPTKFKIDLKNKTIQQYSFQNFYKDSSTVKDTLIVYYKKTFDIKEKNFNNFLHKIQSIKLDSTIEHSEGILDGMTYQINTISSKKDSISLTSNMRSRSEKSKLEYELLDPFFELTNTTIDDPEGNSIVEYIQKHLLYTPVVKKLKVKMEKTSESPIEYKIWGELSGCKKENNELVTFLNKLPRKTPIIFDLTKGNFSDCLNKNLLIEFENKKEFYFYGNEEIKWIEEIIEITKSDLENPVEESSESTNDIDLLLGSNPISKEEDLEYLTSKKIQLNKKKIFLTRNEIIKIITKKRVPLKTN